MTTYRLPVDITGGMVMFISGKVILNQAI